MKLDQLPVNEYAAYYASYIQALENVQLIEELEISQHELIRFVQDVPMDKFDYRHAEGKWTLKDILLHLIDAERIFSYRALRIARNDKTALPGFDENFYVDHAQANDRSIQNLLSEFATVRAATLALFKSFSAEMLARTGTASDNLVSVRAIGFIILGHQKHHQRIFRERYLN